MEHQRALSSLSEFRGTPQAAADLAGRQAGGAGRPISRGALCRALLPLDILLILASSYAAHEAALSSAAEFTRYAAVTAFGMLLAVNLFSVLGNYATRRLRAPLLAAGRLTASWTVAMALMIAVGVLSGVANDYSQLWALNWFIFALGAMLALRGGVYLLATHWARQGRLGRRVAILGDPYLTGRLARHFTANPERGIHVAGVFADSHGPQASRSGLDGDMEALIARLRSEPIDSVILAPAERGEAYLRDLRQQLSEVPVSVWLCPGGQALNLHDAEVSHFAGIPAFSVMERPIGDWRQLVKEIEDRTIAGLITLMISPLLLAIAVAIKYDSPGPLLFRQKRRGFNNEIIEVLKFRTMSVDKTDSDGERLTERDDPRITRVGAFLRRWSLDELPQFFNVLRGDMSVVGPRPHALRAKAAGQYYFDAVPFYDARHRVKPGITGLAQISGWRGPTETVTQIQKRVEHDIYYIEHWSLWLDLKIILLTAFKGFKSENAF